MNFFSKKCNEYYEDISLLHNMELAKKQGFYRAFSKTVSYLKRYNCFFLARVTFSRCPGHNIRDSANRIIRAFDLSASFLLPLGRFVTTLYPGIYESPEKHSSLQDK